MNLWNRIMTMFDCKPNEGTDIELWMMDNVHRVKDRRFKLLVDIDETILNTTTGSHMCDDPDAIKYTLNEDHINEIYYHSKKRPHMQEFIKRMRTMFEIHLFTLGSRSYARKMEAFISEELASLDGPLTMCGYNMAVVIHASPEVFGHLQNAVHLRPSLSSVVGDDYLMRLDSVLAGVHERCYTEVYRLNLRPEDLGHRGLLPDVRGAIYLNENNGNTGMLLVFRFGYLFVQFHQCPAESFPPTFAPTSPASLSTVPPYPSLCTLSVRPTNPPSFSSNPRINY